MKTIVILSRRNLLNILLVLLKYPCLPGANEIERVQNLQNALIDSIKWREHSFEDIAKKYSC